LQRPLPHYQPALPRPAHGRRAPLQDARRIRIQPSSPAGGRQRVLEAQMRGYVAVMMAERQVCLDDLTAHGLTPTVYGFDRGLRSSPDSA
jgi:hypothetical protein